MGPGLAGPRTQAMGREGGGGQVIVRVTIRGGGAAKAQGAAGSRGDDS